MFNLDCWLGKAFSHYLLYWNNSYCSSSTAGTREIESADTQEEGKVPPSGGEEETVDLEAIEEDKSAEAIPEQQEDTSCAGKKRPRKRKYVLKGGASALAIQLFGIDDRYEMRFVHHISDVISHQ